MKKLCALLALLLLLSGCRADPGAQPSASATEPAQPATDSQETGLVTFDIFAINDLHGRLTDTDAQPGVDELSTYLKQARQATNTILLATGDMWQGTAESNLTQGALMTEWMNEMGFAAMTLGGHEYDWGEDGIRQNEQLAEFPFLAINIYSRQTDRHADYCQSSVILEVDGAQIGIIGAIGNCYGAIAAEHTKDVYFKTGQALTELVMAESQKLRSQGVDFIIYAIHDGYDQTYSGTGAMAVEGRQLAGYYDPVLSEGYVDLVFEGHSHQRYVMKDEYGVYHLQGGGDNDGITHVAVGINSVTGTYSVQEREFTYASTYQNMTKDAVVQQLLEKYSEQIAPSNRILGYNAAYRSSDYLRQLVAQLYLQAGIAKWGAEYDIVLGGGFLSVRSPYDLQKGDVSYATLQAIFPFDNQLVLCSVKGSDLLSKFINTSNSDYFIARSDNRSIDPNGTYYIIVDSYTSTYAPNKLTEIQRYGADIFARDLLAEYIEAGNLS